MYAIYKVIQTIGALQFKEYIKCSDSQPAILDIQGTYSCMGRDMTYYHLT